jgi:acyl-coenzyme A synthetase/AMP-(fatty) acid ligase
VQYVERTERNKIDSTEIIGIVREAITKEHEIYARHIVLIRPGTLPKTTSGKIQRSVTRARFLDGTLDYLVSEPAA